MSTKIEWTEETWNPVTGCTKISEGCKNCYAERMAKRLAGRFGYPEDDPFRVTLHPDKLEEPLRWRKPRTVFVCSMSDLFHKDVPFEFIKRVWDIAESCPQHTFQILTKRPQRMLEFTKWMAGDDDISIAHWPRNCWLGVTAENQQCANERIPILLETPAAVLFVSVEPMLGRVELINITIDHNYLLNTLTGVEDAFCGPPLKWNKLDWVICGGESGQNARPMHPDWVRSLRDQCQSAGVPFFFKQWGEWKPVFEDDWEQKGLRKTGLYEHVGKKKAGRLLDGREWNEYPRP